MDVYYNIRSAQKALNKVREIGNSIGLVPTMGALHAGHLSLLKASVNQNDVSVTTIFVNPLQFNNDEDLANYPSTLDDDLSLLEANGCNIVVVPEVSDIYTQEPKMKISFGELENTMEGVHRPGHFNGVALVVLKLFNLLEPNRAYFGQKDIQQFKIIEQMVVDASIDINPVMMPIIREPSGLAMSSRNKRLSGSGKALAVNIYKSLNLALLNLRDYSNVENCLTAAREYLTNYPEIGIEYLSLVNYKDLQVVKTTNGTDTLVLCFAGHVENIRLIDNIIIEIEDEN